MKLKHRVLTLLLTIAMLLTFMPAMAFAQGVDYGDPSGIQFTPSATEHSSEGELIKEGNDEYVSFGGPCFEHGDVFVVSFPDSDGQKEVTYTYDEDDDVWNASKEGAPDLAFYTALDGEEAQGPDNQFDYNGDNTYRDYSAFAVYDDSEDPLVDAEFENNRSYLYYFGSVSKIEYTHDKNSGNYEAHGGMGTDGYYDDEDEWVPTSEEYLRYDDPEPIEGDTVKVTFYSGDVLYTCTEIPDPDNGNDSYLDWVSTVKKAPAIDICTEWDPEQSYATPLEGNTATFRFYLDDGDYVEDKDSGDWVWEENPIEDSSADALRTAVLINDDEEEDDDEDFDFGDLPSPTANIPTITLGKKIDASVNPDAPVITYKFTAPKDGWYVFESFGSADVVGQARTEEEILNFDDDKAEDDENFKVVFEGVKGETYYLQAMGYSNENLSFQIRAIYEGEWMVSAFNDSVYVDENTPAELKVVNTSEDTGFTYTWYKGNGTQIATDDSEVHQVTETGAFYCIVSKGGESKRVDFFAFTSTNDGRLWFNQYDENKASVRAFWDGDEGNETCKATGDIKIPSSVTFYNGKSANITRIEYGGFYNATEMTSVEIPNTVTRIGADAFVNTGLKSIYVPASVTTIGGEAIGYNYSEEDDKYTPVQGFTIFGQTGSVAQAYANSNGFTFRDPDAEYAAAVEAARQGVRAPEMVKVSEKKPKAKKTSITVKWTKLNKKKLKKSKATHYEIWVCPNTGFARGETIERIVKKSKKSLTVKGLTKKTTYYVRVRAIKYVNGQKVTGAWSQKKVKTKK